MNPLLSILLVVLAVFGLIVLVAVGISLILVLSGERHAGKQRQAREAQLAELLDGDLEKAQKLLDGVLALEECGCREENAPLLQQLLNDWKEEKEWIRTAVEENKAKRRQRKGWLRSGEDTF